MTTINNSQLIEKVGGIEKAREIIAGAHWENISYSNGSYYSHSYGKNDVCLNDLRTAIAEHDLKQCQHGYDIACLICGFGTENGVRVWRNQLESDEVTDIRNHVSLSTKVIDHE
jgi:hypothetical protein